MKQAIDLLISPIGELATPCSGNGPVRGKDMHQVERIKDAAIAVADGKIVLAGKRQDVLDRVETNGSTTQIAAEHSLVTPGLVDPHTHLIFGGNRAHEFIMRCQGKTYTEIAQAGGGIVASMSGTRSASQLQLLTSARERLQRMKAHGTTTCEIKTGYGLDSETELLMLDAIFQLKSSADMAIVPTFMPAHAIPPGVERTQYVRQIVEEMLPEAARMAERSGNGAKNGDALFVDVFCDEGYFTVDDTREILGAAKSLGMQAKVHADEFKALGATKLAMDMGAASVDHLLKVSDQDIASFAASNTIPILLPGTSFYLNLAAHAPARKLIDAGAAVALGSDFNPGSCHIFSLPFIWGLACIHLKMTPEEALTALTINAAYALKCGDNVGRIAAGYRADITIYDVPTLEEVPYNIGWNPVHATIRAGRLGLC
jgi:imidazolonepropionase